jgi:PAS domain S-box-containing protein
MLDHFGHNFMPHGMCYLWQPDILALHVISDALITLAYFTIPFTLLFFVRKRRDLEFNWMFVCFAVFIVACGSTHAMEIWNVWHPDYWLSGSIKAITALASVPTAFLLMRLIPQALAIPSPSALRREVAERQRAEQEVRLANEALERRVAERTAELETANQRLREEVQQRQKAEESLIASQRLLAAIVDNSAAVIYVKDLEGRYLLTNRRFEEIFQLARGAILGRTDYELFERAAADAFRAMDQRAARAEQAIIEEELAPQPDGPHVYLSIKAPLRDAAGRAYATFGISTDITDRKRIEDRLHTQIEHLSLLDRTTRAIGERQDLESIFQVVLRSVEEHLHIEFACICLSDSNGGNLIVHSIGPWSEALADDLGLRRQSRIDVAENGLERCMGGELLCEPDLAPCGQPLFRRFAGKGLRGAVLAPLMIESKMFGVMICARTLADSFSPADCEFLRQLTQHVALATHQAHLYDSLQTAYHDLRQSQQSVMQQERLRALGQMASGIAHDINNALSPAALYVQTLLERETALSTRSREQLTIVQRAIEDVANTVARMREFYRPREAKLKHEMVDLNRVIEQVVELTRARWSDMPQERGVVIRLQLELQAGLPPVTGADHEIRDAITNLVLNAVDAMPDGGTLTLRSLRDVDGGRIHIEVQDTGAGMSDAVRQRCLEPFFTTKGERGTGLGLAMVYGMAKRHGAELNIDTAVGQGTTLRLSFPGVLPGSALPLDEPPRFAKPLRMLIIDDDPLLLQSLRDTLEADGHAVVGADGGQAGIDEFAIALKRGEPFEFVITDLGMPHVDGRTVAASIKGMSPDTPVVMLTGWGHRLQAEGDLPEHVDRVLGKPPKLKELREVLMRGR